jgi:glucose-6-phosphate isomerase, archaeal
MTTQRPFAFQAFPLADLPGDARHTSRYLSDMRGYYADRASYEAMLAERDILLYEVYEIPRPEQEGELLHGLSILHPGKVGDEYFMTKGHFHQVLDTAEVYYCLQGKGMMVMETPEGEWAAEELEPGRVLYVPPRWAHRSVNTASQDLITFYVYPAYAGHDYGTIETRGFHAQVIERDGAPLLIGNPRWQALTRDAQRPT